MASNTEASLGYLESRLGDLQSQLAALQAQTAALAQTQWQQAGNGGGGESGTAAVSAALASGAIGDGSFATPGTGSAVLKTWNGTGWDDGETVDVLNYHDKTFADGAGISVYQSGDVWVVFDVESCSKLS